jgi:uncharacterized Ntn-hydrolase superfamily protein
MSIGERAERRLDRRGLHVNGVDAADALGEEVREADPGITSGLRDLVDFRVEHRPDPIAELREELAGHERGTPRLGLGRSNTSEGSV